MKKFYLILLSLCLLGCAAKQQEKVLQSEADLKGLRLGVLSGSYYDIQFTPRTDLTVLQYNSESDAFLALSKGNVDVVVSDDCAITDELMEHLKVKVAFFGKDSLPYGIGLRKEDHALRDSLSYFIDSLLATGEMKEIKDRWFLSKNPSETRMPDFGPKPTGAPLKVGTGVELSPLSYLVGDEWRGFENELVTRFGYYINRPVVINFYPYASLIASIQMGKTDLITGFIFITEERKKMVDFSSSHSSAHVAYFVKDNDKSESTGFIGKMKEMVYNNLIVEDRWHFITGGLWETVKISLLSILLGSLLGALLCWMRMNRHKWISKTAAAYITLMRGIPMLVFLMIMFYVVFAHSGIGATLVAVVAFSMNFAAYVSEMFRTAILAVGKGQTEAGLALGLTKWQTFTHIIAPQAIRNVMPVYKGESISLIKNTSIVGYIAIQDLTRASDIIRTRTFDALFPLLIVTILYFILAWLLGKLLDLTVKNKKKI